MNYHDRQKTKYDERYRWFGEQNWKKKSINRNEAIDIYNDIIKKGKIIAKERQTKNTQKFKKKIDKEPATNMPDLESEETAAERRIKKGQGLKILPITLAQLKAGNNFEKFRN